MDKIMKKLNSEIGNKKLRKKMKNINENIISKN